MWKMTGVAATLVLSAGVLMNPVGEVSAEVEDDQKSSLHNDRISLQAGFDEGYEEEEPNDSIDAANPVKPNMLIEGHLTDEDEDYFTFEIDGEEKVDFHLAFFSMGKNQFGTEMEMNADLFDADGQEVEAYSEGSDEHGYGGSFLLEPGVYYMKAIDEANLNTGEPYMLIPEVYEKEPRINRFWGVDRYWTAANIARQSVALATGSNFADALAGSVRAVDEPLLLTPKSKLDEEVKQYFIDKQTTYFQIFGGKAAVDEVVEKDIWSIYE